MQNPNFCFILSVLLAAAAAGAGAKEDLDSNRVAGGRNGKYRECTQIKRSYCAKKIIIFSFPCAVSVFQIIQ